MIEVHIRHGQASAEMNWGLTEAGKQQARTAAKFLTKNFSQPFAIGIHSGSRRAEQTAHMLDLTLTAWSSDSRLREADWKGNPEPKEFEPWRPMYTRVAAVCKDLDHNLANKNRVVVTHGGTMRMVRAYREGLIDSRYSALFQEPYKYFTNCQMIIYTDENPKTKIIEQNKLWVKSVCPWNEKYSGHDWIEILY